jgi:putative hydrolase of the HAD superfamily
VHDNARAILLDALGTLVALERPTPSLRRELAERFGIEISAAQAQAALAAEIAYYRAHLDEGRDPDQLAALRRRCAEVLRAALPASDRLASVDTGSLTAALLSSLRFTAFPDARTAITAVRTARPGVRVVVVSNWDVSLVEVLVRLELTPFLDGVVTSAGAGARKPDPAIFMQALAIAGVSPERAVHIGDSIDEDVVGARRAGITPILLRRDGAPGPAGVRTIASLAELDLGELAGRGP